MEAAPEMGIPGERKNNESVISANSQMAGVPVFDIGASNAEQYAAPVVYQSVESIAAENADNVEGKPA